MGWQVEILDEDGNVVDADFYGSYDRSYRLPDGRHCRMLVQETAWCRDCQHFGTAERVPDLTEIDETIAALAGGGAAYAALLARRGTPWTIPLDAYETAQLDRFAAGALPDWQHYREWRLLRRSPPRCLNCFSTDIVLIRRGSHEAVHPVTGRRIEVRTTAHLSMSDHYPYDVEGLPLPARRGRAR